MRPGSAASPLANATPAESLSAAVSAEPNETEDLPAAAESGAQPHASRAAQGAHQTRGVIVLAIGLPGSGKSSWFKRRGVTALSSDLIRTLLFYDISVAIAPGRTPVYPGDPGIELVEWAALARGDAANVTLLHFGAHTATHVDAPAHFIAGAAQVLDMPLEVLIGPAHVVELGGNVHAIDAGHIAAHGPRLRRLPQHQKLKCESIAGSQALRRSLVFTE